MENKNEKEVVETTTERKFVPKSEVDLQMDKMLKIKEIYSLETRDSIEFTIDDIRENFKTPVTDDLDEKKEISNYVKDIIVALSNKVSNVNYTLSKEEYLYLKDIILKKIVKTKENIYIALFVKDEFFDKFDDQSSVNRTSIVFTPKNGTDLYTFNINIGMISQISSLLSLHTISDLTDNKGLLFANILKEIKDVIDTYNVFAKKIQDVENDYFNWLQGLNREIEVDIDPTKLV